MLPVGFSFVHNTISRTCPRCHTLDVVIFSAPTALILPRPSETVSAGLPARHTEPPAATEPPPQILGSELFFPLSTDPAELDAPPWRATARHAQPSRPPACAVPTMARPTIRQTCGAALASCCRRRTTDRADRTRLPIFQLPLTCGGQLPARLVPLPRQVPTADTTGLALHSQIATPGAQPRRRRCEIRRRLNPLLRFARHDSQYCRLYPHVIRRWQMRHSRSRMMGSDSGRVSRVGSAHPCFRESSERAGPRQ